MQLEPTRGRSIRARLSAAACMVLASGVAGAARSDPASTQLDASMLLYGEQDRTDVYEPAVRVTRLFSNGQSLGAQFEFDAMTGASPSGALPSGRVQTTTSASGTVQTLSAGQLPLSQFEDARGALDLEWKSPIGSWLVATTGAHFSREKDYQSLGGTETVELSLFEHRTTLTGGASYDDDTVMPVGGTPDGLMVMTDPPPSSEGGDDAVHPAPSATASVPGGAAGATRDPKHVSSGMLGLSQIVTRRWLVGVDATRTEERGYLTEPYKVVSLVDPATGYTIGRLTEKRPGARTRRSLLGSSVYHLTRDVMYTTYRYYWDDWGIRSHTVDLKYRYELGGARFVQPHVRWYSQTAADFFRFGIAQGEPLPEFASSDGRLGPLRSATVGATYGFQVPRYPGDFTVRAEYIREWGNGHPAGAVGAQRDIDLFPAVNIGSLLIGYTFTF